MRPTLSWLVATLLLLPARLPAQDQGGATAPPPTPPAASADATGLASQNYFDVIARGTAFADGSDQARFQRYRDLRNGGTIDAFRYASDTSSRYWSVQADHIGYRDQRYSASYNNFGKLKVDFEWNQVPLFYSDSTATLYTQVSPGVFRINDAIQSGIQNKTTTLAAAVGQAQPFDLRSKRETLDLRVTYSATKNIDLNVAIRNTLRDGNQPWAGTFGFSDAVELAAPVDTRTTDVGTSLEWSNGTALARVGYDGSFFRNNIGTLVWDNPLRITDSTSGPMEGRMALWPNSNMNSANVVGGLSLPARSRATAYISIGNWTQNDPLIPFTSNSALPVIPLDRPTAEAKAVVTAMNYTFTSKPADAWWFSARYRSYDFDNRTPVFDVTRTVTYDTSVSAFAECVGQPQPCGTTPYSFTRRTFDADTSYTGVPYTALRVGYTREGVDQTFRTFDTTTENTVRASADMTRLSWFSVRAQYEHAKRVGSGVSEQTLDEIGEQTSLRQFDISDRTSDRFSGIFQVMPVSSLAFNGTVSAGREDRPDTTPLGQETFGLRSNTNHAYSIGFDFVPGKIVALGASYEFEKYDSLQASRQANPGPQFNDPTRDWTTDGADRAHTVSANLDLVKPWPKTDLHFAYDFSRAESIYVYGLAPNSTLAVPVQLPPVLNELQRGTAALNYTFSRHLAGGVSYWFEKYLVNNFAQDPQTLSTLAQPSFLVLGYLTQPYTANTIIGRLTYLW